MGEDSEQKHIQKHICDGFDRTDWSVPSATPEDFTLHSSENINGDHSHWPFHSEHPQPETFSASGKYRKKRVKIHASLGKVSSHKSGKGPRKYFYNALTPNSEIDQLRSDIKVVIIIGVIAVVIMFAIYFSIVIPFIL